MGGEAHAVLGQVVDGHLGLARDEGRSLLARVLHPIVGSLSGAHRHAGGARGGRGPRKLVAAPVGRQPEVDGGAPTVRLRPEDVGAVLDLQENPVPEYPEITVYLEAMARRLTGEPLEKVRMRSPSLVRTWDPPLTAVEGLRVRGLRRMGKRVVWQMEHDLFVVIHLMISGRLRWRARGAVIPGRIGHAAFDFPGGTLVLTEASSHKRASLHVVQGEVALSALDPGGLEPLDASLDEFREALVRENRTLKRALTDPRILSGIGNAHSDEILLFAGLSPVRLTRQLDDASGIEGDWLAPDAPARRRRRQALVRDHSPVAGRVDGPAPGGGGRRLP